MSVSGTDVATRTLEILCDSILIIPFDAGIPERAARLRHDLKARGVLTPARALGLLSAAIALHHGLELVTYDRQDYDDIPELLPYET